MNLTRRNFVQALAGLSLPAWFPRMAFATSPDVVPGQRDILICLFMRGGADGLNIVVPVGDSDYYAARPSLAIAEPGQVGGALELDGFYALHPSLAPLKELYDEGVLAAIHAVGSPDDTRSHFDAMDFMERGTPGEKSLASGWLGRHLATVDSSNDSPFRAIGMGRLLQTSLRGPVPATALQSIAEFHLGRGQSGALASFQESLARLYSAPEGEGDLLSVQAQQTFDAIEALSTADPLSYEPENGAQYPVSELGFSLLQVAQMIKADLGLEVACVDAGGWDTHESEGGADGRISQLLSDLAGSLAAFHADLGDRMARVTVVTMSEFGRRVSENAAGGTDHGHGNCMFLLGGGVAGGRVYGDWPGLAPEQRVGPGDLAITTDFRTVLAEVVEKRLLNPASAEVFPGFEIPAFLGLVHSV